MRKRNIPCVIYGGISFYDQKEIRDILAYLRLVTNQYDEEALRRIINYPARGIGNTTVDKIFRCAHENDIAPWTVIQQPDLYGLAVNKGTKSKLADFSRLIGRFMDEAQTLDAYQVGQLVLKESGLMAAVQSDSSSESREIIDNYSSLLSGMSQFVDTQREEGNTNAIYMADFCGRNGGGAVSQLPMLFKQRYRRREAVVFCCNNKSEKIVLSFVCENSF